MKFNEMKQAITAMKNPNPNSDFLYSIVARICRLEERVLNDGEPVDMAFYEYMFNEGLKHVSISDLSRVRKRAGSKLDDESLREDTKYLFRGKTLGQFLNEQESIQPFLQNAKERTQFREWLRSNR